MNCEPPNAKYISPLSKHLIARYHEYGWESITGSQGGHTAFKMLPTDISIHSIHWSQSKDFNMALATVSIDIRFPRESFTDRIEGPQQKEGLTTETWTHLHDLPALKYEQGPQDHRIKKRASQKKRAGCLWNVMWELRCHLTMEVFPVDAGPCTSRFGDTLPWCPSKLTSCWIWYSLPGHLSLICCAMQRRSSILNFLACPTYLVNLSFLSRIFYPNNSHCAAPTPTLRCQSIHTVKFQHSKKLSIFTQPTPCTQTPGRFLSNGKKSLTNDIKRVIRLKIVIYFADINLCDKTELEFESKCKLQIQIKKWTSKSGLDFKVSDRNEFK